MTEILSDLTIEELELLKRQITGKFTSEDDVNGDNILADCSLPGISARLQDIEAEIIRQKTEAIVNPPVGVTSLLYGLVYSLRIDNSGQPSLVTRSTELVDAVRPILLLAKSKALFLEKFNIFLSISGNSTVTVTANPNYNPEDTTDMLIQFILGNGKFRNFNTSEAERTIQASTRNKNAAQTRLNETTSILSIQEMVINKFKSQSINAPEITAFVVKPIDLTVTVTFDEVVDVEYAIDWGDTNIANNISSGITHTYEEAGTYTIIISATKDSKTMRVRTKVTVTAPKSE